MGGTGTDLLSVQNVLGCRPCMADEHARPAAQMLLVTTWTQDCPSQTGLVSRTSILNGKKGWDSWNFQAYCVGPL